jgi:Holliday junction resolvase-like predicted endonuclease
VFVEVKAREGRDFGEAAEAVTARKRRRMTHWARLPGTTSSRRCHADSTWSRYTWRTNYP